MGKFVAASGPHAWEPAALSERDWLIHLPDARPATAPTARSAPTCLPPGPAARLLAALREGPGFAVLRGLRLDGLDDQACAELGRRIAALAGTPRPHESAAPGDHLLSTAPLATAPPPAAPTGPADTQDPMPEVPALAPHTDRAGPPGPPHFLALLCVRPAPTGGASLLISATTVHDRLAARHPGQLAALYADFHFGAEPGLARTGPVFARHDSRLAVHYNRHQIERGHHAAGVPLGEARTRALDAFDGVLADQDLALRVPLRRGDLLLLDNTAVLHGRTAFTDHPDPSRRRCLTRSWAD
ncbi:TauD/TfdA family dioxygenase [Streptomyces sp. NPDC088745]|uniref:TauD/TfdA family dioxygenase n=1 Tax=Streptomyces sp. NPDC088745 TaxID=3365884 RepID=UPI00381D783F